MTVSLTKATDLCSTCGADCAPTTSFYIDPLCTACKHTLNAEGSILPLDTLHDLALALRAPAAAMPTNDYGFGIRRAMGLLY